MNRLVLSGLTLGAILGVALFILAVLTAIGHAPLIHGLSDVASLAVAGATILLADATAALAWLTRQTLLTTRHEAEIAARALEVSGSLATSAATQARLAWLGAFPHLRPNVSGNDIGSYGARFVGIEYVVGILPARAVEVWMHFHGQVFGGNYRQIMPGDGVIRVAMGVMTDPATIGALPLHENLPNDLAESDWWLVIRWYGPANQPALSSWVWRANIGTPSMASEHFPTA